MFEKWSEKLVSYAIDNKYKVIGYSVIITIALMLLLGQTLLTSYLMFRGQYDGYDFILHSAALLRIGFQFFVGLLSVSGIALTLHFIVYDIKKTKKELAK